MAIYNRIVSPKNANDIRRTTIPYKERPVVRASHYELTVTGKEWMVRGYVQQSKWYFTY